MRYDAMRCDAMRRDAMRRDMKPLNVLSLFDGISCAQIALERAGFEVANYFASEIEKASIKITQHNYPNTIQLGDVTKIKASDLPQIDLLVGGSPCQGFSICGKQLNFDDPRSELFFEYARLLKECMPGYFLLENVKMKQEYQDVISECIDVRPTLINSRSVSAQSRDRLYWSNIDISEPNDKGLVFKDIIDCRSEYKYVAEWSSSYREVRKSGIYFGWCESYFGSQGQRASYIQNKFPTLSGGAINCILCDDNRIRRVTLIEQERLQTVPDNYTNIGVSDSVRHKALGNGFTVDVIAHIFKCMRGTNVNVVERTKLQQYEPTYFDGIAEVKDIDITLQAARLTHSDFNDLII